MLLSQNRDSIKAWEKFINSDEIDNSLVRDEIARSWIRSREHGVNPHGITKGCFLSNDEFLKRHEMYEQLVHAAVHFMKILQKTVLDKTIVIRLTDRDGYVLECFSELYEMDESLMVTKGCNISEKYMGTNAISLALIEASPVQVLGGEHYCKAYHEWTSSAAPIRDENGRVIGVISVTGPCEKVHPHTLGMVVAAAEAIENELMLEDINKRLKITNKHLFAIMESISEGLIGIDEQGMVKDINLFARRLLSLEESDIIGKSIDLFISEKKSKRIKDVIKKGKKQEEVEMYFKNKRGKKVYCIVSFTPIIDCTAGNVEGVVVTFRKSKTIHNLVNRITGAEAIFSFDDILGESDQMLRAKHMALKAAKSNTTILLNGESGTGKELFAHAIHNESKRKNKPFVTINCGAIPRELVASELFGYIEGAFTGAKRGGHPGKFELADEGTIFLDEIGDMPLDAQTNLLRVLETKKIVRIGDHNIIPIDARVIAATHKDLEKEVEKGNFRKDLYYRLNVMPINTPTLRSRRDDIRLLIDVFFEKFNISMGKSLKGIDESFYIRMRGYDWPGNVRELQNVMQLVINMAENGEVITEKHIPANIKGDSASDEEHVEQKLYSLEEIEKTAIINTLRGTGKNIALSSKILGIGRSTLYRKMEKYGIEC